MPQLTEDQIRQIEILLDPHFKERKEAEEHFKTDLSTYIAEEACAHTNSH